MARTEGLDAVKIANEVVALALPQEKLAPFGGPGEESTTSLGCWSLQNLKWEQLRELLPALSIQQLIGGL